MENILEITELNFNEMIEIEGGYSAYEFGHDCGKALIMAACIMVFL